MWCSQEWQKIDVPEWWQFDTIGSLSRLCFFGLFNVAHTQRVRLLDVAHTQRAMLHIRNANYIDNQHVNQKDWVYVWLIVSS